MPTNMPTPSARGNFFDREDVELNVVFSGRLYSRWQEHDASASGTSARDVWATHVPDSGRKERKKGRRGKKNGGKSRKGVDSTGAYHDSPSDLSMKREP
jgi:hypothetical protein